MSADDLRGDLEGAPEKGDLSRYIDMMARRPERVYCSGYRGYRRDEWSFARMKRGVLSLSRDLAGRDVGKGDAVILIGHPTPRWILSYFAVLHRGGVVVPLDADSSPDFARRIVDRTRPALLIAEEDILSSMGSPGCPAITLESTGESAYEEQESDENTPPRPSVSPQDLAVIVFTSGTTSRPKGVMLSHANILSVLLPIERGLETKRGLVRIFTPVKMLSVVPFSHMFGQVIGIYLPLLLGGTVHFTRDTSPASLVRTIRRHRIVALITVPRIMKLLADHVLSLMEARGKRDRFLRRVERLARLPYPLRVPFLLDLKRILGLHFWAFIVGGAALDPETHEFWRKTVYAVFQGYGLTETAPIVSLYNPFRHQRGSAGQVFPGQEVRVAEDGEILIRGSNVMLGYFQEEEATRSVMEGGWFRTGDIGEIGADGQLYVKGRKKDVIVTPEGRNVHAEDVEEALVSQEGVREAVVVGMPGDTGEAVHAVLVLEEGAAAGDVVQEANRRLQPFQRIRGYTLWEEPDFPRTPTQKVRKSVVKEALLHEGAGTGSSEEGGGGALQSLIPLGSSKDARLGSDLGLDSLDMVEVALDVERRYGVSLEDTVITPDTTVSELESQALSPSRRFPLSMSRWNRSSGVRVLRWLARECVLLPLFRLFMRIDAEGLDNLAQPGGRFLSPNHVSDLDPVALLLALPLQVRGRVAPAMGLNRFAARFTGHARSEGPDRGRQPVRSFVQAVGYGIVTFLFNTYPFPQTAAYRPSMEYTGELIDGGFWVLIFPEGRVSEDGAIGSFKGGVGKLAAETDAPVHPVRIDGMHRIFSRGALFPRFGRVRVAFGPPLRRGGENAQEFAKRLEEAVRSI